MDEEVTIHISNKAKELDGNNQNNYSKAAQHQHHRLNTIPPIQSFLIKALEKRRVEYFNTIECNKKDTIQEELQRFQHFFNHSRDIMLVVESKTGKIIGANPAADSTYGYLKGELLNKYIFDLRVEWETGLTVEQMRVASTKSIQFETTHRRKDGSLFPVEVNSRCAQHGENSILFSVIRDLTERQVDKDTLKKLENQLVIEELIKERVKMLEVEQIAKIGYYEWNLTDGVLYWSDQMYRNFGITPQDITLTIESFFDFIYPEDKALMRKSIAEVDKKEVSKTEFRIVTSDGSNRWMSDRHYSVLDENGKLLKKIGTIQDITEEKQSKEQGNKAEQAIIFANELYRRSMYINNLIMNDHSLSYTNQQLNEYGIDCNITYCCYVLKLNVCENEENIAVNEIDLEELLVWFFENVIGWVWKCNRNIIFLAPIPKNNIYTKEAQIDLINVLILEIKDKFSFRVQSGISGASETPLNIKDLYEQAYRSLLVGEAVVKQIVHYEDIGFYDVAFQLLKDTSQCKSIKKIIGKLAEYDEMNDGNLLLTLEQILKDGNLKLSAQKLFIHYNTAIWRKQRIEKILGFSLDNIETKCMLILYLKVWKILNIKKEYIYY